MKILFIYPKAHLANQNSQLHSDWIYDCRNDYKIDFWGKGWNNRSTTLNHLKYKIDVFKPNYIYLTIRKRYREWLPDLTSINVPKIFVECDEWNYNADDDWYKQFTHVYCRQPRWNSRSQEYCKKMGSYGIYLERLRNIFSWKNVPLFRWSIPENVLVESYEERHGVAFVGGFRSRKGVYEKRIEMNERFKDKIQFLPGNNIVWNKEKYYEEMRKISALVCPTESNYGDFVAAKIFEYAASGAAILTNCDLVDFEMDDLDKVVIKYTDWDDLENKLNMDFSGYWNKGLEVMKAHTHRKRYKEIFV